LRGTDRFLLINIMLLLWSEQPDSVLRHAIVKSPPIKNCKCWECNYATSSQTTLEFHMIVEHGYPVTKKRPENSLLHKFLSASSSPPDQHQPKAVVSAVPDGMQEDKDLKVTNGSEGDFMRWQGLGTLVSSSMSKMDPGSLRQENERALTSLFRSLDVTCCGFVSAGMLEDALRDYGVDDFTAHFTDPVSEEDFVSVGCDELDNLHASKKLDTHQLQALRESLYACRSEVHAKSTLNISSIAVARSAAKHLMNSFRSCQSNRSGNSLTSACSNDLGKAPASHADVPPAARPLSGNSTELTPTKDNILKTQLDTTHLMMRAATSELRDALHSLDFSRLNEATQMMRLAALQLQSASGTCGLLHASHPSPLAADGLCAETSSPPVAPNDKAHEDTTTADWAKAAATLAPRVCNGEFGEVRKQQGKGGAEHQHENAFSFHGKGGAEHQHENARSLRAMRGSFAELDRDDLLAAYEEMEGKHTSSIRGDGELAAYEEMEGKQPSALVPVPIPRETELSASVLSFISASSTEIVDRTQGLLDTQGPMGRTFGAADELMDPAPQPWQELAEVTSLRSPGAGIEQCLGRNSHAPASPVADPGGMNSSYFAGKPDCAAPHSHFAEAVSPLAASPTHLGDVPQQCSQRAVSRREQLARRLALARTPSSEGGYAGIYADMCRDDAASAAHCKCHGIAMSALDGEHAIALADGSWYEGTWRHGKLDGHGSWRHETLGSYTGGWRDHEFHGSGIFTFPGPNGPRGSDERVGVGVGGEGEGRGGAHEVYEGTFDMSRPLKGTFTLKPAGEALDLEFDGTRSIFDPELECHLVLSVVRGRRTRRRQALEDARGAAGGGAPARVGTLGQGAGGNARSRSGVGWVVGRVCRLFMLIVLAVIGLWVSYWLGAMGPAVPLAERVWVIASATASMSSSMAHAHNTTSPAVSRLYALAYKKKKSFSGAYQQTSGASQTYLRTLDASGEVLVSDRLPAAQCGRPLMVASDGFIW
jgi:hypothetical protein